MLTGKFYSAEEIEDIKNKYPKFIKHVKMHLLNIPKDDPDQFMVQIPEQIQKSSNILVDLMLETAIRDLYDFFDENKMVLDLDAASEYGKFFSIILDGEGLVEVQGSPHTSRTEAEKAAFLTMMGLYEERNR